MRSSRILPALGLLLLLAGASRATPIYPQPVMEVAVSSFVIVSVQVSSAPYVQVDSSTRTLTERRSISIQNQDASAKLYCRQDGAPDNSNLGIIVAAGGTLTLNMAAYDRAGNRLSVWCKNDNGTGPTTVLLMQLN